MVTRAKFEQVYTLWKYFNWTAGMIQNMVDLKPWEVEAIVEQLERDSEIEGLISTDVAAQVESVEGRI